MYTFGTNMYLLGAKMHTLGTKVYLVTAFVPFFLRMNGNFIAKHLTGYIA